MQCRVLEFFLCFVFVVYVTRQPLTWDRHVQLHCVKLGDRLFLSPLGKLFLPRQQQPHLKAAAPPQVGWWGRGRWGLGLGLGTVQVGGGDLLQGHGAARGCLLSLSVLSCSCVHQGWSMIKGVNFITIGPLPLAT